MKLYSTQSPSKMYSLEEAVMKSLPDDGGLFMPSQLSPLEDSFFEKLPSLTFSELAFEVCNHLIGKVVPTDELQKICEEAFNFDVPLVPLADNLYVLELFHGPSMAFKDFGARFMARLMAYFNKNQDKNLNILVATSGDTGGAVASGFYKTKGINVVILYPSGKVSSLQEKQLTTLGYNIHALEIDGTFDDCQALVKKAFLDKELTNKFRLSSANSINIARLIPQTLYYFEAYRQLKLSKVDLPLVFSVPSGNFGNLTAGIIAKRLGLPVHAFVAATNDNNVIPEYLNTGVYTPRPSVKTLSNAMDVGNPSNFSRMLDLYTPNDSCNTCDMMNEDIFAYSFNDEQTIEAILEVKRKYDYILDPHTGVAYLALKKYQSKHGSDISAIMLETAHPAKFLEDMEEILGESIPIPAKLKEVSNKNKEAIFVDSSYPQFKNWLLENLS